MFTDMVYIRYNEDGSLKTLQIDEDLVSVVRCKDCAYDLTDMCMMMFGDNGVPKPNDYCSYGVKK